MALEAHNTVASLCEQFKADDIDPNGTTIAVAKAFLEAAKIVVPPPFDSLVGAALLAVEAAENAVVNKRECGRLASRIARINCFVLDLSATKDTAAVQKCAEDLKAVFKSGALLLKEFLHSTRRRWADLSWADRVKATYKKYSPTTAKAFAEIHTELDTIVNDTNLAVALQLRHSIAGRLLADTRVVMRDEMDRIAGPSLADIRVVMRDEMDHVVEQIQCLELKGMNAVHQRLQEVLHGDLFDSLEEPQQYLDARDVVIDLKTVLGGTNSIVYAGTLYGLTEVAVKVVKAVDKKAISDIEDEVRRANRVRHRHVVRIFGIVLLPDKEAVGVVMELLGVSLEAGVEKPSARMKYTLDIIAGLEHMHIREHRVIHFDIKPANILLTRDERRAKIIGFRFARTASTLAIAPNEPPKRGTTPFMAPELFSKLYRESSACDVYSFAVVLAELWTGTLAWDKTQENAINKHVKAGRRPFFARHLAAYDVPSTLIALIEACWAQNPCIRPTFAQLAGLSENFDQTKQENWPYFIPRRGFTTMKSRN
jgi:hypothetical protein